MRDPAEEQALERKLVRGLLGAAAVAALMGLLAVLAGCAGPTGPSEVPSGPEILARARPDLQASVTGWWAEQEACVGGPEVRLWEFPVDVVTEPFTCGDVLAAGCMRYSRIEVVARWLENALTHEYIHLILWKQGQDYSHASPGFAKCDWRNLGRGSMEDLELWLAPPTVR